MKVRLLQDLLHPTRLKNVLLSGRLLGEPNLLQTVLQAVSHKLLGLAKGTGAQRSDRVDDIVGAISDPNSWHVQLEYLALLRVLASEEALLGLGADHGLTVAMQGERLRVRAALARVENTAANEELLGFVGSAMAYL
eukprot:UN2929